MPAGLKPAKVSALQPSKEELAKAKAEVAALDKKGREALSQSLRSFLKNNPDDDAEFAKGAAREVILEKFHIHRAKCREGYKKNITTKEFRTHRKLHHTLEWMSEEQMDEALGPKKAQAFRDAKTLPVRPCRVTKKWDRYLCEWGVPKDVEVFSEEELRSMKHTVETELSEEDATYFSELTKRMAGFGLNSIPSASTASGIAAGTPEEPTELSPAAAMALKMVKLKADIMGKLSEIQALMMDIRMMKARCDAKPPEEKPVIANFEAGLVKHVAEGEKIVKGLQKMITDEVSDNELPKFILKMEAFAAAHESLLPWALKFEVVDEPSRKKRKRLR